MLPASTISPPVDFKPIRRPAESRPFREDPPAFLCAMSALSNSVTVYTDSRKESSHFFLLLFLAFCGRFGGLFCGRFLAPGLGLAFRLGPLGFRLALGRFACRFGLGLALGPRRRRFRRLGAVGQGLGVADHRELVAVAALAARILAPAILEGDYLVAARVLEHLAGKGGDTPQIG